MLTEKQLEANRANAQKSTGPTSVAGLEKVSQNALKHGLCGKFQVLPSENQAEYDDLFERFMRAEKPADDSERELVAKMARHTWLAERAIRCQDSCFIVLPATPENEAERKDPTIVTLQLERFIRYHAAHDRAYQRASKELLERRKQRLKAENGSVSQKRAEAEENRKTELHPYKVQVAKARAEREQSNAAIAATRVAAQVERFTPPETVQIAA